MEELLQKKIDIINKLKNEIEKLSNKVQNIFADSENIYIKNISYGLKHIESDLKRLKNNYNKKGMNNEIVIYNSSIDIDIILEIINDNFNKILDKKVNIETFLSQTYINETREYNAKVQILFSQYKKEKIDIDTALINVLGDSISEQILQHKDKIYDNFDNFTGIMKSYPESALLYKVVSNKILQNIGDTNPSLTNILLELVEQSKNNILSNLNDKVITFKYKTDNTFIKNFGLITISKLGSLDDITKMLYKHDKKITNIEEFSDLCKSKNQDLIVIKKFLNRGVNYNVVQLLDFNTSMAFEKHHKTDDGITEELIDRYKTIEYIDEKSINWKIKYDYVHENIKNNFVLILQELHNGKFCIIHNKMDIFYDNKVYFVRKSSIEGFLQFVKKQNYKATRVGNYNELLNKKIAQNMFLHMKPNIDELKIKSQIIDPKYLRYQIYIVILSEFKELYEKSDIKNLYTFSKLIHDESFEKIFSNIIMNEYIKYLFKNLAVYEAENISMSEVYTSFLYVINIYERDFKKKLHDTFLTKIPEQKVFKLSNHEKEQHLYKLFDNILDEVLKSIITNENNIFQTILYKLYLFKLSLLD